MLWCSLLRIKKIKIKLDSDTKSYLFLLLTNFSTPNEYRNSLTLASITDGTTHAHTAVTLTTQWSFDHCCALPSLHTDCLCPGLACIQHVRRQLNSPHQDGRHHHLQHTPARLYGSVLFNAVYFEVYRRYTRPLHSCPTTIPELRHEARVYRFDCSVCVCCLRRTTSTSFHGVPGRTELLRFAVLPP